MIPDSLKLIHQPVRLQIMTMLVRNRDVGFGPMRDALDVTNGNLQSHCRRLEDAGLLVSRRALGATGIVVRFAITAKGDATMAAYVAWLRQVLQSLENETDSVAPADRRGARPPGP